MTKLASDDRKLEINYPKNAFLSVLCGKLSMLAQGALARPKFLMVLGP
jgi:hypothetical protein